MRKRLKRGFLACTLFLILLYSFTPFVFATTIGQGYSQPYMPVCPAYLTRQNLPFGEDTVCIYYKIWNTVNSVWLFFDKSDFHIDSTSISGSGINTSIPVSGFYVDDLDSDGTVLDYWRFVGYSTSKIIKVVLNENTGVYQTSFNGTVDSNSPINSVRYKYIFRITSRDNVLSPIICSESYYYCGSQLDYYIANGSGWGTDSNYYYSYYVAQYPDTVNKAILSIETNRALMEQYYIALDNQLTSIQSSLTRIENTLGDVAEGVTSVEDVIQQGNTEVVSQVNEGISQAVDDINNAGEDVSDLDDDMSDVNGIVEKCSEWVSSLDSFADSIDDSADSVAGALDSGTSLFNRFLGVCPPIVLALFGFAIVFLVVRKIIGR